LDKEKELRTEEIAELMKKVETILIWENRATPGRAHTATMPRDYLIQTINETIEEYEKYYAYDNYVYDDIDVD
jgi:hypothetical protein